MDFSPPDSAVHGLLQARVLEWVAISFSRRSSQPRDQTQVSCIGSGFFTTAPFRAAPSAAGDLQQTLGLAALLRFLDTNLPAMTRPSDSGRAWVKQVFPTNGEPLPRLRKVQVDLEDTVGSVPGHHNKVHHEKFLFVCFPVYVKDVYTLL